MYYYLQLLFIYYYVYIMYLLFYLLDYLFIFAPRQRLHARRRLLPEVWAEAAGHRPGMCIYIYI